MLKYWGEYNDMINVVHRFEIYDDNFVDTPIEINGSVWLDYSNSDTTLEAIRGQGLRIELDADETMTFEDLYSEQQKTIPIHYYRDSVLLFQGWLDVEGWYENWVDSKWQVSFDAIDGLGYLENLSFVEDATGLPITSRLSMLECISLALIRTGLQQNINIDVNIFYTGLDTALSIVDNVYINAERYIKDDGETIMSCTEVLRDILEPFCACIISKNGEWYIYRPNQLFIDPVLNYFRYDYLGVALTPAKETLATSFTLGSSITGAYPHHCSANQQKNIKNSIGAYRVNYKYGQLLNLNQNPYLCWEGGIPPVGSMQGWTIYDIDNEISYGSCGVQLNLRGYATSNILMHSDDLVLTAGITLGVSFEGDIDRYPSPEDATLKWRVMITQSNNKEWIMTTAGSWQENNVANESTYSDNIDFILAIESEPTPVDGTLTIDIWTANGTNISGDGLGGVGGGSIKLNKITLVNVAFEADIEGEFHTVQRTDKPSSNVPDVKEVYTGDNVEENYIGALYKNDLDTPTSSWFRLGHTEEYPILRIMGEDTLRMSPVPATVFSGDVYGFFEYLSVVSINTIDGLFMVTEFSYDSKANIISAKFVQIFGGELPDIEYEKKFDYGNTVKPTIKG